jgi:hypothetical protein
VPTQTVLIASSTNESCWASAGIGKVLLIERAGRMPVREDPDVFVRAVSEFLAAPKATDEIQRTPTSTLDAAGEPRRGPSIPALRSAVSWCPQPLISLGSVIMNHLGFHCGVIASLDSGHNGIMSIPHQQAARRYRSGRPPKQIYSCSSEACRRAWLDHPKVWPAGPRLGCHLLFIWPQGVLDGDLLHAKEPGKARTRHSTYCGPMLRCMTGESAHG